MLGFRIKNRHCKRRVMLITISIANRTLVSICTTSAGMLVQVCSTSGTDTNTNQMLVCVYIIGVYIVILCSKSLLV